MSVEALGLVAGALTTFSFAPQVYTVYRTKSTRDISLVMYIVLNVGCLLWVVYGVLSHAPAVWVWNLVTFLFAMSVLAMKVYWEFIRPPTIDAKVVQLPDLRLEDSTVVSDQSILYSHEEEEDAEAENSVTV